MSVWTAEVVTDVAELIDTDGVWARITALSATTSKDIKILWEGLSMEGGEQGGWRAWAADTDLPTTFPPGSSLLYPLVDGTTYHVSHKARDGHGLVLLTLVDESDL